MGFSARRKQIWMGTTAGLIGVVSFTAVLKSPRAFQAAPVPPSESESTSSVLSEYRSWVQANPEPYFVPAPTYHYCAQAPPRGSYHTSPHLGGYITVFVNPVGQSSLFDSEQPTYPVGTLIVKEKRPNQDDPSPTLMTVMRKRPAGFDPKHGDWEYSTHLPNHKLLEDDAVDHCQICHARVKDKDFVFRDYLRVGVRSAFAGNP